jgi:lipopolysaccharide biosynthesis glycosyltransferase
MTHSQAPAAAGQARPAPTPQGASQAPAEDAAEAPAPAAPQEAPLHLVFAADDRYSPGLQVAAASTLLWLPPERTPHLHVFDGGLRPASWRRLERALRRCHPRLRLHRHDLSAYRLDAIRDRGGSGPCAYARLLIPQLLEAPRALYLDVDLILLADVAPLHDLDLRGHSFAAAVDPLLPTIGDDAPFEDLPADQRALPYFNSGVMVLDLERWRRERIGERTLAFLADHGPLSTYYDQTALNHLLRGQWLELAPHWNSLSRDFSWTPQAGMTPEPLPAVLHFYAVVKPWVSAIEPWPAHRLWHRFARQRAGLNPFTQLNRLVQRQLLRQAVRDRLKPEAAAERRALARLLPPPRPS